MTKFINLTPHKVVLNDGRSFDPVGTVARVAVTMTDFVDDVCDQVYGDVVDLPAAQDGVVYIVSAMVLSAAKAAGRKDCVAPATGHKQTVRNDAGQIVSVPGFVR